MPVEAAVGESGGLHGIRDADTLEATLAKEARGRGEDAFSMLPYLLSTDLHKLIPIWKFPMRIPIIIILMTMQSIYLTEPEEESEPCRQNFPQLSSRVRWEAAQLALRLGRGSRRLSRL